MRFLQQIFSNAFLLSYLDLKVHQVQLMERNPNFISVVGPSFYFFIFKKMFYDLNQKFEFKI